MTFNTSPTVIDEHDGRLSLSSVISWGRDLVLVLWTLDQYSQALAGGRRTVSVSLTNRYVTSQTAATRCDLLRETLTMLPNLGNQDGDESKAFTRCLTGPRPPTQRS